jgi:lipopolysaccharide export system protein LptA
MDCLHIMRWIGIVLIAVGWAIGVGTAVDAADPAPPTGRIQITSDRLVVNNKSRTADFTGNVRAVQDTTTITADRIRVYYNPDAEGAGENSDADGAIRNIESSGNVTIRFDDKVAVTQKAIYNTTTGILTLSGENTRVTSGQNVITGKTITVDRNTDQVTVVGQGTKRVEAVIFTSGDAPPADSGGATSDTAAQ